MKKKYRYFVAINDDWKKIRNCKFYRMDGDNVFGLFDDSIWDFVCRKFDKMCAIGLIEISEAEAVLLL